MDSEFDLNGIRFVWSQQKARTNLAKHQISFEQAAEAFFDPFLVVIEASVDDESRDAIVALDEQWNLLFVVHLEAENDRFRIISARRATKPERKKYEG